VITLPFEAVITLGILLAGNSIALVSAPKSIGSPGFFSEFSRERALDFSRGMVGVSCGSLSSIADGKGERGFFLAPRG
jgi:hypothetical protein